jgi:hypothetical protein
MNNETRDYKNEFLAKVENLFAEIKQWIADTDLVASLIEIEISEEVFGVYKSSKLLLQNKKGQDVAEIIPIGASILGANGRVDIKGLYDSIIIVDLNKGGPSITTTQYDSEEKPVSSKTTNFYRGINEAGWYWIENRHNKGHPLDAALFFELLSEISDYERD